MAQDVVTGGTSLAIEAIRTQRVVRSGNIEATTLIHLTAEALANLRSRGSRSILAVPMIRQDQVIGAISLAHPGVEAFSDNHVELLKSFADQAMIAVENVRLFEELQASNRELRTALDTQTATSDILGVISRSPTDVQPVFDAILASAVRLLGAYSGLLTRVEGDQIVLAALTSTDDAGDAALRAVFPMSVQSGGVGNAQVIRDRQPFNLADAHSDPRLSETGRAAYRSRGSRSQAIVPLLRQDEAIGTIAVTRREPGGFTEDEIALLQTFADQAVIAIENVRLFTELQASNRDLTTALEQQTATSELLKVIGRSTFDLQPVFDAILASATGLLRGYSGILTRVEGDQIVLAALTSTDDASDAAVKAAFPQRVHAGGAHPQTIRDRVPLNVTDAHSDARLAGPEGAYASVRGYRSLVVVPMLRHDDAIGTISVTRRESGGFTADEIALLQTFADQAVIAIENARLLTELQARTHELTRSVDQLTALGEVGRAVSSSLDLDTVLNTIVGRAVELSGTDGGTIFEYDQVAEEFTARATLNTDEGATAAVRASRLRRGEGAVGQMAVTREPFEILDITTEGAYESRIRGAMLASGTRSVLAIP